MVFENVLFLLVMMKGYTHWIADKKLGPTCVDVLSYEYTQIFET